MRQIFNLDGPVFTALSRLADLVILNLLFLLCCVPVVTIGASLTAMSYVTLKMREGREGYVWKSFFRAFKQNFLQATVIWLIMFAVAAVIGVDVLILRQSEGTAWSAMRYIVLAGAVLWLLVLLYVFPLLARFYNSTFNTLRNALLVAFANAPRAILMAVVCVLAVVLTFWNVNTLIWGTLIWLLVGFSALSVLNSTLQLPVFRKMAPDTEDETEEETEEFTGEEPDET